MHYKYDSVNNSISLYNNELLLKVWKLPIMEDNSIYISRNYGVTKIKLKEILIEKGISRSKLCSLVGANFDLINRYYNNSISRVDLDIISRFCYVLNCNISDILEYTPSDEK